MAHTWYGSTLDLADGVRESDARGQETYFACASYATEDSRKGENALAARALWCDIDVGPTKPYHTVRAAFEVVSDYLKASGLWVPHIVSSGAGLHCYWVFDADIPADEWRLLATKLKASLAAHGVAQDPSRTADIASILRPPETHNRKYDPAPKVRVLGGGEVGSAAVARSALGIHTASTDMLLGAAPDWVTGGTDSNSALGGQTIYLPSSGYRVAEHCAVVAHVRDTQGSVDQPTWYHTLGVIAHTTEGEDLCHEWSSGHPAYTAAETAAKVAQARSHGPTTCAKLAEHQPALCGACPHSGKIKSPIVLGVDRTLPCIIDTPGTSYTAPAKLDLPRGYRWYDKAGLLAEIDVNDPNADPVFFCRTLFYPVSSIEGEQQVHHMEIEMRVKEGQYRRFMVPCSTIAEGGAPLAKLLGQYQIVALRGHKESMAHYLQRWLDDLRSSTDSTRSYSRFGWHGESFVVGTDVYAPGAQQQGTLSESARNCGAFLEPAGTYEAWVDTIDKAYNYPGQEVYQYLVLCGFAAMLMPLLKADGGVTVYGWSEGSGHGKTTAMRAALSVWGDWNRMQMADNSATVNALWGKTAMYSNIPVLFDELTNIDPKVASTMIYTLGNGRVKQRANQDGSMRVSEESWSTIMLASGNNSISEKLAGYRNHAEGEIARLFELRVDNVSRLTPNEANTLFPLLRSNYGHAGRVFARYVVDNRAKVEFDINATRAALNDEVNIKQSERYWSALHASVLTALTICRRLDIVGFDREGLKAWVVERVSDSRGHVATAIMPMRERIGTMLSEMSSGILTTRGEGNVVKNAPADVQLPAPHGNIVGRAIIPVAASEVESLHISVSAAREWCNDAGVSAGEMHRWGVQAGWIRPAPVTRPLGRGTLRYATATSAVRCWDFDVAKLRDSGVDIL